MQMQTSRRSAKVRDLLIAAVHRGQNFRKGAESTRRNALCTFMQAINSIAHVEFIVWYIGELLSR